MTGTDTDPPGNGAGAHWEAGAGQAEAAANSIDVATIPPTTDKAADLDIARGMATAGIPVFVAYPAKNDDGSWNPTGGHNGCGYWLPKSWQTTTANPRYVDAWRPGMALCAVMGHGLDLIDLDPRNGGNVESLNGFMPTVYGVAATPSGGWHGLIKSMGVRSRDNALPGIDVKAGDTDGQGRGFMFLAPTIRKSKTAGQMVAYRWERPPDLDALKAAADDHSGQKLADLVRLPHGSIRPGDEEQDHFKPSPWDDIATALAGSRRKGVSRLAQSLRGRGGFRVEDALSYMRAVVFPLIDQQQNGHPFTVAELEAEVRDAFTRYDDGPSEEYQTPTTTDAQSDPGRYFEKRIGLLATTLAGDIITIGPLAEGADDLVWSYRDGVWSSDRHVVRNRAAHLLGETYRRAHGSNAEDVVRSKVRRITCAPIGDVINFRNGLYYWHPGQLHPHTPDVLSTVQLAVDWNPEASCPNFEQFLTEVLPDDLIDLMWELIGYLMYSGNPLHKAVMLMGTGRNGKGTLLRVLVALLGERNVTAVALHDLVNTRFATASLFGKIANIAGDIDGNYLENTAMFKAVTGQDQISAEHKGRDRFDFTPWAVPVFSANKVPASSDVTTGYLSRWLVIPFPHDFTGREDRRLDAKLQTGKELQGIAAKAIPALRRLLTRGDFDLPASAALARDEFARRVDQVRTWLDECCDLAPDHPFTLRTPLYQLYTAWTKRDGHKPVKATEFYDRLEGAGVIPHRKPGAGDRGFLGIKVTDRAEEEPKWRP